MPTLAEALACCAVAGSLEACRACLETASKNAILDEDRHFQLWEESRLPIKIWQDWHAQLVSSPPKTADELGQTLAVHLATAIGLPSATKLDIDDKHRPVIVARGQWAKVAKVNSTRGPLRSPAAADKKATGYAAPAPGDTTRIFDDMIRRRTSLLWIGWRPGVSAAEFLTEISGIRHTHEASHRFALDWAAGPSGSSETAAYLFVFALPTGAQPMIPTMADAVAPARNPGEKPYWHRYFLPAPPGSPAGVLRNLDFASASAQKAAGHPGCLAEAVMAPQPGAAPQKPVHAIPLIAA